MTFAKHAVKQSACAIAVGFLVLYCASCGTDARSQKVRISVAFDTKGSLVLTIENPTAHIVLFDDPRSNPSAAGFEWELLSGKEVIATIEKARTRRDPLIGGHLSHGPVDIWPTGPVRVDLARCYPDLTNKTLLAKADSLLWYCRVWDQTAAQWIPACGVVRLHSRLSPGVGKGAEPDRSPRKPINE